MLAAIDGPEHHDFLPSQPLGDLDPMANPYDLGPEYGPPDPFASDSGLVSQGG